MAPTGPFLMPDGRSLAQVLKHSDQESVAGESSRRKGKTSRRGKDLQFAQVAFQHARAAAAVASGANMGAQELAELRALEAVGVRRRRRWLNDRTLRELAGPMSMADIERQFKPVPFGWRSVSALEVISQPQHAVVWEGFRNIDSDKEARVLQRWEQHNRELTETERGVVVPSAATQALQRWSHVSKKGRAALRKAKVHTVLALEAEVLDFLEAGQCSAMRLSGLDGWGRLLVHAIADFWGLSSSSSPSSSPAFGCTGSSTVSESPLLATCKEESGEGEDEEQETGSRPAAGSSAADAKEEQEEGGEAQDEPVITVWHRTKSFSAMPPPDITVSDVVEALAATGGNINANQLTAYMRTHVHGSEAGRTDEWVVV